MNARVQGGMSGSVSTCLALTTPDGKRATAFVQGAHPELKPGINTAAFYAAHPATASRCTPGHTTCPTKRHSKRAFLTEGPLKGDVASYLSDDSLFVCLGGVSAIGNLEEVLTDLGVTEVIEAMDMDMMVNPQVRTAVLKARAVVQGIPGIKYRKYTWNPAYKGIDDYYKSLAAT